MSKVLKLNNVDVFAVNGGNYIMVQPERGIVTISCWDHEELNGMHCWNAIGSGTIYDFLIMLDEDYVCKKLFGLHNLQEYDHEETSKALKRATWECRKCKEIDKDDAREIWDSINSARDFGDLDLIEWPGFVTYDYYCSKDRECFTKYFWPKVWIPFVEYLRTEKAERISASQIPPV